MRKKLIILLSLLAMQITLVSCGGNGIYTSGKKGYTEIDAVDGVLFEIASGVANSATALINMSPDMDYDTAQTYVYKDGEEFYFIFNMNSLVCVVQKDTNFALSKATDIVSALKDNGSISGIWFGISEKKPVYSSGQSGQTVKYIVNATAQVSLNSDVYADFTGKLATIENNGEEWTMYVGTIGSENFEDLDKEMQESLSYMAETFAVAEDIQVAQTSTEIVLGGDAESESSIEESVSATTEEVPDETLDASAEGKEPSGEDAEESIDETEEDAGKEQPTESKEEAASEEEVDITVNEEDESEPPKEETEEEIEISVVEVTKEPESKGPVEEPKATEAPSITEEPQKVISDTPSEERTKDVVFVEHSNQKKAKNSGKAVSSDVYSMLSIGEAGKTTLLGEKGAVEDTVMVLEILTGEDAESLIKKYCDDGTLSYAYFEAMDGCTWHVAHYTLKEGNGYANVKFCGLDGEALRQRGITYSKRSYDIKVTDTEFYSYYAVPNGCTEYALEIGEGNTDNTLSSAYYHIETGKK